jgi:multidrug efflux pump subunit AcrB
VVAVVWNYNGLTPEDMSRRVVYYYERSLTTTVSNIEHIDSESLYGRGIVKIFFQPGTDVAAAQAQVTAVSQTVLKQLPRGSRRRWCSPTTHPRWPFWPCRSHRTS